MPLDKMFEEYERLYKGLPLKFSICDDGSPTPAVVPDHVTLTRLPAKKGPLNPCVPINQAVAASRGEIVVLTNVEIQHKEPILREMLSLLGRKTERAYVMARCKDAKTGQWLAGPETDYGSGGRSPTPAGGHYHFLVMLWRKLWDQVAGFDEEYREGQACDDNDWLWRLAAAGAQFKTTEGVVLHHQSGLRWGIPHNRQLFIGKWPEHHRQAIERRRREWETGVLALGEQRRPNLKHPEWALVLGGGEAVWDEVLAWEKEYGRQWDGLVIAANDVGCHWPRYLDHWCTLHPEKMEPWLKTRARYGFSNGVQTWGRRAQVLDHALQPWAGGASGMLAIQVAQVLSCSRAVLCGMPMTPTPHFAESLVQTEGKNWNAVAGHWRAWGRELVRMKGWVRSMSGRTQETLGVPTLTWLLEDDKDGDGDNAG